MPAFPLEAWNFHTYQAEAAYVTSPRKYLGHRIANKPPWLVALHVFSHLTTFALCDSHGKGLRSWRLDFPWTLSYVPFPFAESDLYQINVVTIFIL